MLCWRSRGDGAPTPQLTAQDSAGCPSQGPRPRAGLTAGIRKGGARLPDPGQCGREVTDGPRARACGVPVWKPGGSPLTPVAGGPPVGLRARLRSTGSASGAQASPPGWALCPGREMEHSGQYRTCTALPRAPLLLQGVLPRAAPAGSHRPFQAEGPLAGPLLELDPALCQGLAAASVYERPPHKPPDAPSQAPASALTLTARLRAPLPSH